MGRNLQKLALWTVPLLFMAVLFYWAMWSLLRLGLEQDWLSFFGDQHFQKVAAFTVGQALLSTLSCLLFGIPAAMLLYRRNFLGRDFVRALIAVPFVLPTIVVAIALQSFAKNLPTLLVILIAHLFLNFAIVVRTVGGVWQSLDKEIEYAAAMDGAGAWQTFWRITLPQLRPAIASASALVFLYCVTSFGIILLLGGGRVSSIETEIYFSLTQFLDFKTAAAYSIMQTIITVLVFVLVRIFGSNSAGIEQVQTEESNPSIGKRDWPIVGMTAIFVIVIFLIPIAQVVSRFSWQGLVDLTGLGSRELLNISVWQAAGNSLRNLLIAAGLSLAIGVLVSWLLSRSRRGLMELPFLLPMGVSSVVLGFGYLLVFRGGWLAVPLVQAVMATPLVIRIVHPALVSLGAGYREDAMMAGANNWQIWRFVEAPLLGAVLRSAAVYAALVSLGEFGAASLLSYGDQATLPVVLYQLISRPGEQNYAMAMAACALMITSVFLISMSSALVRKPRRFSANVL